MPHWLIELKIITDGLQPLSKQEQKIAQPDFVSRARQSRHTTATNSKSLRRTRNSGRLSTGAGSNPVTDLWHRRKQWLPGRSACVKQEHGLVEMAAFEHLNSPRNTGARWPDCQNLCNLLGKSPDGSADVANPTKSVAAIPAGARVSLLLSKEHRIRHVARRLQGL